MCGLILKLFPNCPEITYELLKAADLQNILKKFSYKFSKIALQMYIIVVRNPNTYIFSFFALNT